ncbi:MAG: hypothetical protein AABW51_00660 [Nanoarchaeota archaeon]
MSRDSILDITEKILKRLSNKKEHTINNISNELKIQWRTSVKVLEFLERIGLAKERRGKITYKQERLFSIRKK